MRELNVLIGQFSKCSPAVKLRLFCVGASTPWGKRRQLPPIWDGGNIFKPGGNHNTPTLFNIMECYDRKFRLFNGLL